MKICPTEPITAADPILRYMSGYFDANSKNLKISPVAHVPVVKNTALYIFIENMKLKVEGRVAALIRSSIAPNTPSDNKLIPININPMWLLASSSLSVMKKIKIKKPCQIC